MDDGIMSRWGESLHSVVEALHSNMTETSRPSLFLGVGWGQRYTTMESLILAQDER